MSAPPGPLDAWRCWACWGELVREWQEIDGRLVASVHCPKGCQPVGFVRRSGIEWARAQNEVDYYKVAHNYPELFGVSWESQAEPGESLFGE